MLHKPQIIIQESAKFENVTINVVYCLSDKSRLKYEETHALKPERIR